MARSCTGQGFFGEVEHAGQFVKSARNDNGEFATVKIKTNNLRAFTLIEMVLAIGVAAIVLVAINTVLFAALRLRDATATRWTPRRRWTRR